MCDTLAVVTSSGTWFAKSSDRSPREVQVVEGHADRPGGGTTTAQSLELPDPGAARVLASRPTWLRGYEHGVNEHRVAVGNERIWTTQRPTTEPGHLLGMDLVRIALERSTDADTALDALTEALERYGQGGVGEFDRPEAYDSSFLIVDPRGGWHVETRGASWAAAPIGTPERPLKFSWNSGAAAATSWRRWRAFRSSPLSTAWCGSGPGCFPRIPRRRRGTT